MTDADIMEALKTAKETLVWRNPIIKDIAPTLVGNLQL
jgi:hypothetical protein